LRNPLAPIRNAVALLRMRESPELKWVSDVIERQSMHLSRLLDDLLDVSRITRGKVELRKERVALADVVLTAVETSRPLIDARHHALDASAPSLRLDLIADPVRLAQCISNLLNNAARYTPAGGRIQLICAHHGRDLTIRVRDNGIGMSKDLLPQVFDMFTQGRSQKDQAQGGLGIGLSLVREFAQLHGGCVEARSDGPGMGSEFVLQLPIVEVTPLADSAAGPRAEQPVMAMAAGRCRVLVVDDNQDSAETLKKLLVMLGNEVRVAQDGVEAVETARQFAPSVAVMDLGMPRMDGYEAARRMRALPHGQAMLLIALTGWGQQEALSRSREAGYDHHLIKPVDLGALQRLIARPAPH
jgi:CheY-like chemotaxis protein